MFKGVSTLLARRYLFSKKSHSVINIISVLSSFAVGIPVAAMVILLSVFNGLESLVEGMYSNYDPDIEISMVQGKHIDSLELDRERLLSIDGVKEVSMVLDDEALLEYRGRQAVATLRGVDDYYTYIAPIDSMLTSGSYQLHHGEMMQAVVGQGVANSLSIRMQLFDPIVAYTPRRGKMNPLIPMANYKSESIFPSGIFRLDAETDSRYVIVPIEFAQELFDYPGRYTSAMIMVEDGQSIDKMRDLIASEIGDNYSVQTRYQMRESYYRIMRYEKWGIFFITLLVLIIASFSIVGSLAMLIIDKRGDIATIRALGGSTQFVRSIFVEEGLMISLIGAVGGVVLGLAVCWVQIAFGVVKIPASTMLVSSYPVEIKITDLLVIFISFISITYIFSRITVLKMVDRHKQNSVQSYD